MAAIAEEADGWGGPSAPWRRRVGNACAGLSLAVMWGVLLSPQAAPYSHRVIRLKTPSDYRNLGLALSLTGGLLLFGFAIGTWYRWYQAHQAKAWPRADAVVTQSAIEERRSVRGRTWYDGKLAYSYQLGGATYTGTRLRFDFAAQPTRRDAQRALAPYSVGQAVQVYVNPINASDVVIEASTDLTTMFAMLLLCALAIPAGILIRIYAGNLAGGSL